MADVDIRQLQDQLQANLAELQALKKQFGMVDEVLEVRPKHYSPSELKELVKFEQFHGEITALSGKPPGNPWKFRPFPRMVYQAQRHPRNGKWVTCLDRPARYQYHDDPSFGQAREEYEHFASSCQRVVQTEREYEAAKLDGWCDSAQAAIEFRDAQDKAIGQEAAERNYRDRNMSENAQAEVAKAESEHFGHLAEIPEKPRARRGRPPKAQPPAAG